MPSKKTACKTNGIENEKGHRVHAINEKTAGKSIAKAFR
jgi:hypothetical protein